MARGRQQLLVDTLRRFVRRGAGVHLERVLEKTRSEDIAAALEQLPPRECHVIFSRLLESPARAAEVLSQYDITQIAELLDGLDGLALKPVFAELSSDDAADILSELPDALSDAILEELEDEESEGLEELMQFADDTAGGIMSTEIFALDKELTAREAIVALQDSMDAEMVFYMYCINEEGHLVGVLSLRQLLTVPPATQLKDVMISDVISVPVTLDQEEVAALVARYDLLAIPVTDEFNKLVGIITVDDVIDVLRDEATEDMMLMAGLGDDDMASRTTGRAIRTRIPWLAAGIVGLMGAAAMIRAFEHRIEAVAALAAFIPVVVGLSGNVGVQSSTLVVRGIAMGQLDVNKVGSAVWGEVKVVGGIAVLCGILVTGIAYFVGGNNIMLAGAVTTALFLSMLVAAVVGTAVPLVAERLGIDPALATGPILTTTIDLVGVFIYFVVAGFWLGL
ncbi:MAG: magnesium transporter [Deltaproteobacteria bacterium]|nr:magnesium transporter [Deltaproteobacteria bacterium]